MHVFILFLFTLTIVEKRKLGRFTIKNNYVIIVRGVCFYVIHIFIPKNKTNVCSYAPEKS